MKIIVTGTRGIPGIQGGVEKHCELLYPRLAAHGYDVTVISRSSYTSGNKTEYKGVKLKKIFSPRIKSLEAIIHTFLSVLYARSKNPDWLHIHAVGPSLLVPLARLLGLRVVVTHHGPDYDREKWGKLARYFLRMGESFGMRYANEVIVISNVIDEIVRKKYSIKNTHLIFNGVEKPVKATDSLYIESLGLQKGNYILAVGRFVPEKSFDLLIDSFLELKRPEMRLVLAGDADHETSYSRELKQKAKENNISLTGFISGKELNEIYTHARLFVLPSTHEGLPISLLEAMSYDLDVLVSDIPANKEVDLTPDHYFKTGDKTDLFRKLSLRLCQNERHLNYDLSPYNWDTISNQVMKIYNS